MIAVHIFSDPKGQRAGIKLPDTLASWQTPTVVVLAVGDECKWLERGDVACLRPEIFERLSQETLRIGDWQVGMIHEQQTMGRIPSLRVLDSPRKLDPHGSPDHAPYPQYDFDTMPAELWVKMSVMEKKHQIALFDKSGKSGFLCPVCDFPVSCGGGHCDACELLEKQRDRS